LYTAYYALQNLKAVYKFDFVHAMKIYGRVEVRQFMCEMKYSTAVYLNIFMQSAVVVVASLWAAFSRN